ncbi:MAG: transcriptional regulator, family [Actinoallomurus sp.]|jgi:hypothetical protein|nr:transcriptional regulator, family [Actinoallomurus sp.]
MEVAENLAACAHALRLGDDHVPSRDLVTPAIRELRAAVPLFREMSHSEQTAATHTRELALYMSWLAVALADANEPEEAGATASRMLDLAQGFASDRTHERSRVVLNSLEPLETDHSARATPTGQTTPVPSTPQ